MTAAPAAEAIAANHAGVELADARRYAKAIPHYAWKAERQLAVATTDDAVFGLIERWAAQGAGRAASDGVLLTP